MTNQEIFDRVVEMLKARNWARAGVLVDSPREGNPDYKYFSCRYRSPVGPCAVGLFITEEEYDSDLEGIFVGEVIMKGACKALEGADMSFVSELQSSHDAGRDAEEMKRNLVLLASSYELNAGALS